MRSSLRRFSRSRMTRYALTIGGGLIVIAAVAAVSGTVATQFRGVRQRAVGHPTAFTMLPGDEHPRPTGDSVESQMAAQSVMDSLQITQEVLQNGAEFELPASVLAPLASGEFVNFESPVNNPVAVSADGARVFVANTSNNALAVVDATGDLVLAGEVFTGLEPVSVAIQPGTGDSVVWVANMISDTVTVVNVDQLRVLDVINVGDEPVNILFNPAGTHAFVVIQGGPYVPDNAPPPSDPFVDLGHLVTIDTATNQVINTTFLDCNTPRAAVYDDDTDQIVIAALYSGNNTTLAGLPVELEFVIPTPTNPPAIGIPPQARGCLQPAPCADSNGCTCATMPNLWVAQQFSATADIFNPPGSEMTELSPWPDDVGTNAAPLVPRIVPDDQGDWQAIVNTLTDALGDPDPVMVAQLEAEFGIQNGADVIKQMAGDAKDTHDVDLIVVDASNPESSGALPILNQVSDVGTTLTAIAQNLASREYFVTNMQALNHVRLAKNLRGHFIDHRIERVSNILGDTPTIVSADLHAGITGFNDVSAPNPTAKALSLANPKAIAFHASGNWAAVASLGMDRIGIVNGATGRVIGRIDVPEGPRGLAIHSPSNSIMVWSKHASTLSRIDAAVSDAPSIVDQLELFNPEPQRIREGRKFHYSTAFSHNGAHSCDSCHPGTDFDRLAWDLGANGPATQPGPPNMPGQFNHPLKGPMVTQSLRGLDRHEPLHWRGDKPMFTDFNEAFDNLLGGDEIPAEDMMALNDFIKTVVYRPNPYFKRTNAYRDPSAVAGLGPYVTSCNPCHQLAPDLGNPLGHDGAAFTTNGDAGISGAAFFAQLQIVTQMRGIHKKFVGDLYNGFGMIHDGREEREDNAHPLQTFLNDFFPAIAPQDQLNMIAAINAFPSNVMNVVGWQIPVSGPVGAANQQDLNVMIAQHRKTPSHNDVVANGVFAGAAVGYWMEDASVDPPTFRRDDDTTIGLDALLASLTSADLLVFTATTPGSGKRIGVDEDTDALLDAIDPMPQHDNTGDFDLNGWVDLSDFAEFQSCYTGAATGLLQAPVGCLLADADEDGDVDDADFAAFEQVYSGPLVLP